MTVTEAVNEHLRIRDAEAKDAPGLTAFAATLFRDAYAATSRAADLESYIAEHFRTEIQAAEIAAPNRRTLLLEADGHLSGYAQMQTGPAPSCVTPREGAHVEALEIQRFYVAPGWRGRGVARTLMAACLRLARPGMPVWLGVFTHNARAIAFYTKCRFRVVGAATFFMGEDPQRDHVMQWIAGSSFDEHDPGSGRLAANDTGQ